MSTDYEVSNFVNVRSLKGCNNYDRIKLLTQYKCGYNIIVHRIKVYTYIIEQVVDKPLKYSEQSYE